MQNFSLNTNLENIQAEFNSAISLKQMVAQDLALLGLINEIAFCCENSLRRGGKIIFAGNGGSFADSQHLAAEFISRFMLDRPALAAIALGTNSSSLTAIGNDYDFEIVFSREFEAVAATEDVLILISTSGNSKNILSVAKSAKNLGVKTFGLTGKSGGHLMDYCRCLCVPHESTARIQEVHILIGHIICKLAEASLADDMSLHSHC